MQVRRRHLANVCVACRRENGAVVCVSMHSGSDNEGQRVMVCSWGIVLGGLWKVRLKVLD